MLHFTNSSMFEMRYGQWQLMQSLTKGMFFKIHDVKSIQNKFIVSYINMHDNSNARRMTIHVGHVLSTLSMQSVGL